MEPTGIAAVLADITQVVTSAVTWIGSYMGAITASGNELLLVMFSMGLVGFCIGALKRLAR